MLQTKQEILRKGGKDVVQYENRGKIYMFKHESENASMRETLKS